MPRDKWEYRSVRIRVGGWMTPKLELTELDAALNALGAEGWELVSALDIAESHGKSNAVVALFKRPR